MSNETLPSTLSISDGDFRSDEQPTNDTSLCPSTISLYALRMAKINDTWSIQAVFGNDIKFPFQVIQSLSIPKNKSSKNELIPVLYELQLPVVLNDSAQVFATFDNKRHKINNYQVQISYPQFKWPSFHYYDSVTRSLQIDPTMLNKFLFELHFQGTSYLSTAPGNDMQFWDHLYAYSYLLIARKSYDIFDSFLQQFSIVIKQRGRSIERESLNTFFNNCRKFFSNIEHNVKHDISAVKIVVRMISVLPINKNNMIFENEASRLFSSIILKNLSEKLENIWKTIACAEWASFREGLIRLCSIKLLHYHELDEEKESVVNLLSSIPDKEQKQELALCLLDLIRNFECVLPKNQDAAIYSLVNIQHLTLEHLALANSLETFISYLAQLIAAYQGDINELQERIQAQLSAFFMENRFVNKSDNIQFLLNYLKSPPIVTEIATQQIQFLLETNDVIQKTVGEYLNSINHHITSDEFPLIREVMFRSYNQSILQDVNRQEYLSRMLSRQPGRTADYFIVWFKYFLCEPNSDWLDYKKLLGQWTECFVSDHNIFSSVIEQMDMLIESWTRARFNDSECSLLFRKHIIQQCFLQNHIYYLLEKSLDSIKDNIFIDTFKEQFFQDILKYNRCYLKRIQDENNPLFRLITIDRKYNGKNQLVKHLIDLAISLIEITDTEILEETFSRPSQENFIYNVLFNQSLKSSQLYTQVIHCLINQWKQWTAKGLLVKDVLTWRKYSKKQRSIVKEIWRFVNTVGNEKLLIDELFETNHREMQRKIEMKDQIVICLNAYCEHAIDKKEYFRQIRLLNKRFERDSIQSIEMLQILEDLLPLADRLNPYANARSWQAFLRTSSNYMQTAAPATKTCRDILRQNIEILDNFQSELKDICTLEERIRVGDIIRLFPEIDQAVNDLNLLQSLIDPRALSQLVSIVSFWKDRSRIKDICNGIIQLTSKLSVTIEPLLFKNICQITEHTCGRLCASIYDQYHQEIVERIPEKILLFMSYYSSSADLFEFLHSFPADDIYILQEVVNDWDETLINTRVVFDLAVLKNFLDRSYATIKTKHDAFELKHIVASFDEVWQDEQFDDLLKYLQSSSLALSSIKRIHLELTDKEQSKRRQIADILKRSFVGFIRIDQHQVRFDVNIELLHDETSIHHEKKRQIMTFADISELRDRARLLEYSTNVNRKNVSQIESEREKDILRNFIEFAGIVESTIDMLTKLYTAGHPSIPEYLLPQKQFSCTDAIYDLLQENHTELTTQLSSWETILCSMYKKYIHLTYFFGDQFWQIEDYICNRSSFSHRGFHLLRFVGIEPNSIEKPSKQLRNPNDRLENLGQLLSQQQHQKPIVQRDNSKTKRCLLVETTNEGILRAILSLFQLTKTAAVIHRIFYCTERTSWIELRGFVYRCFYSDCCHQLIRPELLSQSIQDQFIALLRSLIDEQVDHIFQMGIVTTATPTDQQLINGLQSMESLTILRDRQLLNINDLDTVIQEKIRHCRLVTSQIIGLGKSSSIRREIHLSKKNYVKFSISGDFNVDTLAERLSSKYSELEGAAIHFNIGMIDHIQQLNEILYCLLLFGSFRFGEIAVTIPATTTIYIELDASPQSTLTKMAFFRHLKHRSHIEHMDWSSLDVTNKQIENVANYLQAILDKTIINKDINPETFQSFDVPTCSRLIQEYFLKEKDPEFVTWTQLSIFISVFNRLFSGFSHCSYFFVQYVSYRPLRMDLVQILLQSLNQFTSLSVSKIRKQQRSITTDETIAFSDSIIRWDTIQPFTLVFTATDEPLFVYKTRSHIPKTLIKYFQMISKETGQKQNISEEFLFPDYTTLTHVQLFIKLTSLSKKYFNKSICPNCYRQYPYEKQQCEHCPSSTNNSLLRVRTKSFRETDVITFQTEIAQRLEKNYILTADNFVKMLLIYMRVQSHIPVLIMGETGCGKTALIQFLCHKILDDDFEVFRIHAGVTVDKISTKMKDFINKSKQCQMENKRLWIFFDEFNTTTNIGLIKEIICERTLFGECLPENMVFLGACNPRREKTKKLQINDDEQIGLRKNRYEEQKLLWTSTDRRLVHNVVSIPETMLEYIWDYGYLDQPIERVYIRTMLRTCRELSTDEKLFDLTVELLVQSQGHFRDLEDVSSVSLRDIARFCRLYNWFVESLNQRTRDRRSTEKTRLDSFILRASLIALSLCYYFRSRSVNLQQVYLDKMQRVIDKEYPQLNEESNDLIKHLLETEQKELIDKKMELPEGTALNRALRDNIFVLLACIINRIPLFLCGKPGSSKSSAVQILISNLKGKKSQDTYFQILPELVAVSFQGSQNCTSESISKVFERAENYTRVKSPSELLTVIVFDEIGLAELSPYNPLKVLHAELEVENNRYGFVGISNWRLDASKMNRALYLSTPDPNVDDIQLIGKAIYQSMQQQQQDHTVLLELESIIIEGLSQAYYDLYDNLKDSPINHRNYFGLRDYYSLIRGIVRELFARKSKANIYEIIRQQLKINFDGVLDGTSFLWQHFCHYIHQENLFNEYTNPSFDLLLNETLNTRSGRYLLLIGENESAFDYVERSIYLHQQNCNIPVRTLVGSSFPGDLLSGNTYAEQYNYRVIMDVILYAETNVTLIMRQKGHVYDNLYDLFNQNFSVSARKKYCRIALGPLYHPRCFVHDDFYCIVFILERDLDKCDPPFLNRFQKHKIDMQALIHPQYQLITKDLNDWLNTLLPKYLGKHFPLFQHLFVDYSQDQLCNLLIETYEQLNLSLDEQQQNIIQYCQNRLLRTSSLDLLVLLSLQPTPDNKKLIEEYYRVHQSLTLANLINEFVDNGRANPTPRLLYTYTQIFEPIKNLSNTVDEVKLSAFKNELELINKIKRHYQETNSKRLLLIRVDYHHEHEHILSLKSVLLNERKIKSDRDIWLIFHLQRNLLNQMTNDVLFSHWSIDMIDDVNREDSLPRHIFENPSYKHLVVQPQYTLSICTFNELVDRCLAKIRYTVANGQNEERINDRRNRIYQHIIKETTDFQSKEFHLRSIIENHLLMLIETISISNEKRFNDWRFDLLTNGFTIAASRSFNEALQTTISMFHEMYIFLLLVHLEKHHFMDVYDFLLNINKDRELDDHLRKLWKDCLSNTIDQIDLTLINVDITDIKLVFDLRLPCATSEYAKFRRIEKKIEELQCDNDQSFDDYFHYAFNELKKTSIYGEEFVELIFNDRKYFDLYFKDQIALHLVEINIHLSADFAFDLLTNNPMRSLEENARFIFVEHNQWTEIVRILEIGTQLTTEDEIRQVIQRQWIKDCSNEIQPSKFYSIVIVDQQIYQLPPQVVSIEDKWAVNWQGADPMIETSLMNLIELIVSQPIIHRATSLQQIITPYSLIARIVYDLPLYSVNNLEKLRSFLSLIRCLSTLLADRDALVVFKDICKQGFDGKFDSCQTIHQFVTHLSDEIKRIGSTENETGVRRTLIKLEVEFLKDWLADNGDSYGDILILLNENQNDLWQYSAKLFTYIDRKLSLFSTLKENNGIMPSKKEYDLFNRSLTVANQPTSKLERLFVNRFHMYLMRDASADRIEEQLTEQYVHFKKILEDIEQINQVDDLQMISKIAWMKYYLQIYAFALNDDSREKILPKIDQSLTKLGTPFGGTLRLFIFKQLLQISGLPLNAIRDSYINRNIVWIKRYIQHPQDFQDQSIRQSFILPTPLFECNKEFERVNEILNEVNRNAEFKQLIYACQKSQNFTYALLSWFIHYYCRFLRTNSKPNQSFIQLIEYDFNQDLIRSLTPLGRQFLLSLCSNFSENSYFRLQPTMETNEIHKRLIALNLVAVLISFRSLSKMSPLGNLLFDEKQQMPDSYVEHLSKICLPGMIVNDPVIRQMMDVRDQVRDRLNRNVIHEGGKFIYQCSSDCPWLFIFQNCGVPNDQSVCVLCQKPIGAQRYNVLIQRQPPQVRMSIDEGLQMINQRIEEYNRTVRFGYYNIKPPELSVIGEKSDHLNRPVSFRFLHLLTHSVLLFLHDCHYLTDDHLTKHFRDHYEKDYSLLAQSCADPQQCHIWLYKLLNHLVNDQFAKPVGLLNTNENVIQLEQMLEEKLIFAHIESVSNEITEYKRAYAEFNRERDSKVTLENFIDESFENEKEYPLINFFNVTKFHTSDLFDDFIIKLQTLPHAERMYPITTFLFKRFDDYVNIQYLYPIVAFSNYLIEKFNYRIKRNDAAESKLIRYLTHDHDQMTFKQLYNSFLDAWYALNLKEVRYGCQAPKFDPIRPKEKFAENTSLAILLLNTSRDESSLLLAAIMKTIAELQNEIVNYFYNIIERDVNRQIKRKQISLQSIRPENLLRLDPNVFCRHLVDDCLVLNYHYGKGRDLIVDYEEIENTFRNLISSLPIIDTDKWRFVNYQFELYGENSSLINDVRARIKQQQLPDTERTKLHRLLLRMNHDEILNYLGSLDYVFTYLRNSLSQNTTEQTAIQTFVQLNIHSYSCLSEHILSRPPFSTIELQFIIDLYEMIEETAFDQVLRAYVKKELTEENFSEEQRTHVFSRFSQMTFEKETIAATLKDINIWISMLKRLMIRVLNANSSLDVPLQIYLERTDLWSDRINETDLQTFQVDDHVLLQHTYVILRSLEQKQQQPQLLNVQNVDEQRQKAKTWFNTTATSTTTAKVVSDKKSVKSKMRV